jgi:hypothetical protein
MDLIGCPGVATSTSLSSPVGGALLERNRLLSSCNFVCCQLESRLNATSVPSAGWIADHILRQKIASGEAMSVGHSGSMITNDRFSCHQI